MLRQKSFKRLLSVITSRKAHDSTKQIIAQDAAKQENETEEPKIRQNRRLGTDDLFFSSDLPFSISQQHEQIFPKAKPTLLDPLIDDTQRIDKSGICAVPFNEIPTLGGQLWISFCKRVSNYLPGSLEIRDNSLLSWVQPFKAIFDLYGPLVRFCTPTRSDILLLCKPQHIEAVHRQDSAGVMRSLVDSMESYRRSKLSIAMPQYEIDFREVAESFKNHLNHRVNDYQFMCNQMALDFVKRSYLIRDHRYQVPDNYNRELCLWSLKCFSIVVFGRDAENKPEGYLKVVNTLIDVGKTIGNCESTPQLWRFIPTPASAKLSDSFDVLEALILRNLRITYLKLGKMSQNVNEASSQPLALLDSMILKDKMCTDNIITTLMDLLVVGVNAVANTAGMVLYHLAKNPEIQERVFWEVNLVLPHNLNELFVEDMEHLSLLKACIIETLRLWPPFSQSIRCTSKEIVVSGYTIPKNTNVVMAHEIAFYKDEHFADAKKFEPRRWVGRFARKFDPLEVMPFCCRQHPIMKELSYRQIAILVAHVIKNFEIEYNFGEIPYESKVLSTPSKPLKFTFKDRR